MTTQTFLSIKTCSKKTLSIEEFIHFTFNDISLFVVEGEWFVCVGIMKKTLLEYQNKDKVQDKINKYQEKHQGHHDQDQINKI